MRASWAVLDSVESSLGCDCEIGEDRIAEATKLQDK